VKNKLLKCLLLITLKTVIVLSPSQTVKIKIKRKIILPSVLYGRGMWFFFFMVEHKLQVTEKQNTLKIKYFMEI
jgi:hypothetical protein